MTHIDEALKMELTALLDEVSAAIASGDTATAEEKLKEAKDKLKPLPGQGTNGDIH